MKKIFYIFAIIAPLITSPALSQTKTPECENATSILSKYCIDEKVAGMGGDCCNKYQSKFRTIQFYCYGFKPGFKTQDIKNEISTLCKGVPVENISLQIPVGDFAYHGITHKLTGETTGAKESNSTEKYGEAISDPNNWQEYEVQAAQQAPITESKEKLIDIDGQIIDSNNNEPLIGAHIKCINKNCTTPGATTDINGKFELSQVPSNATFEISYIGYITTIVDANAMNNQVIQLFEENKQLDGVTTKACNLE